MRIELREITVRELVEGYQDDGDGGVTGYAGRLDIRPPYQREFVYETKQRDAVIDTVQKSFPLNVMYWAVRDDETFEVIDGQQRTISIAQYVTGEFSFDGLFFHNLPSDRRDRILDYRLMVYLCSGTDSEKLDWFRTINIAGAELTDQELRNAVYAGPWVSDAKRYFSRRNGPAYQIGGDYMRGSAIRQEYLETAIRWASGGRIEEHMGRNQHEPDAAALWAYFQSVIGWVEASFTRKRSPMKGVDWGSLYDTHRDAPIDPAAIEERTAALVMDDDVRRKSGIYPYLLTGDERHLDIRAFTPAMKQKVYEQQDGVCVLCKERFGLTDMDADHIDPWSEGGKTVEENCQLLCKQCNRRKAAR